MASKLQARIDKLETQTAPKSERVIIVLYPGDPTPQVDANTIILRVKYADSPNPLPG
jgi:hypothetical protein